MGPSQADPGQRGVRAMALRALALEPANPLAKGGGDIRVSLDLVAGGHVRDGVLCGA